MKIEIEIPKEFEEHFSHDKFKDSLERIMAYIKYSLENKDCSCAGRYEYETIEMLEKAFENSRQAYDVDKVVEKLEEVHNKFCNSVVCKSICGDCVEYIMFNKNIEIVKHEGGGKDVSK